MNSEVLSGQQQTHDEGRNWFPWKDRHDKLQGYKKTGRYRDTEIRRDNEKINQ